MINVLCPLRRELQLNLHAPGCQKIRSLHLHRQVSWEGASSPGTVAVEESTLFYFDLFNFDGYDRFGNTIFEDLKYRLTSRSSIEYPKTKISSFEGALFRKGFHTKYVVYGIYKNEPELVNRNDTISIEPLKE